MERRVRSMVTDRCGRTRVVVFNHAATAFVSIKLRKISDLAFGLRIANIVADDKGHETHGF
jgi:hypothetical protein